MPDPIAQSMELAESLEEARKPKQRWIGFASFIVWSLPALSVLLFFSHLIHSPGNRTLFFSADALYLPSLYHDLFHAGGHIADWFLPPSPYLFPDMPLFFYRIWRPVLPTVRYFFFH